MSFTITDLRQYAYCPRIPYFTYVMPLIRPLSGKMREGLQAHEEQGAREMRRTLSKYGLRGQVERHEDVWLSSQKLRLSGRLDLLLVTTEEAIPVEYKNTAGGVGINHRVQLTAAALLVEERWNMPVRRGFVHALLSGRRIEVAITDDLRDRVRTELAALQAMVDTEMMPGPTSILARCTDCEFRRFCNDRP